jgi:dynein heavy chain 2
MVFGDLIKLNTMYQFSLSSFIKLFNKALNLKPQAANTEQKLQMLSNSLIRICFSEIGRSLFKADRLTYSMHFVKGVFPAQF